MDNSDPRKSPPSDQHGKAKPDPPPVQMASVPPASFYGTSSQRPPPLPDRPATLGSSNTQFYVTNPSPSAELSPFREPELVPDDESMPDFTKLADVEDTAPRPFQFDTYTPRDNTDAWATGWQSDPGPWSAAGVSMTTVNRVDISARNDYEETHWWDKWVRDANRRPGPGLLPPLLADRLHDPDHSLYSVSVTPPDLKMPPPPPRADGAPPDPALLHPASQPTAEEVRMAVPHPNAYYCRRDNGWVLLIWKSSSMLPPLAASFNAAHPEVPLPDHNTRRRTQSCIGDSGRQFGPENRTHHFHVYERAVDARTVTPPFRRSEWEEGQKKKQRRRKMTLRLDELENADALLEHAATVEEPMEIEEDAGEVEGDLLDLYVCCQCSFYALASKVIGGVIPAKLLDELVKDKFENPILGKNGHETAMMALETILTIIENRLWRNESRLLPVSRKTFKTKLGWTPLMRKIFQSLDFETTIDADAPPAENLQLVPPKIDPSTPAGKLSRSKLLRAWVELGAWITDYRRRFSPNLKDFAPHKLWLQVDNAREIYQTAIGAHPDQIARPPLPTSLEGEDQLQNVWTLLGMTETTYSWELMTFAYLAQCRCDPAHTIDYFTAFYDIFELMSRKGDIPPTELQSIILEERTRNRFTHENLQDAVKLLGFGKDGPLRLELDEVGNDQSGTEFIENAWKDAVRRAWRDPDASKLMEVNDAFRMIAEARENPLLHRIWELAKDGGMTPERAYNTLDIPKEIDDALLITIYSMRVMDQPNQAEKMREAISVIAETRESDRLRQFLITGADPGDVIIPTRSDWPRGLNQLGNTCYLNSLLQYFYTIKDLRDAVAPLLESSAKAIEDDKLTDDDLKRHRVGGRLVTRREILRSKKFVGQLAELFHQLEYNEAAAVTPTLELAKLALVTSKDEEEDDADKNGTDSSNDTDATLVEDAPPRATVPDSPMGSPGEGSSSSVLGKRSRDREFGPEPEIIEEPVVDLEMGMDQDAMPSDEPTRSEIVLKPPPLPPRKAPSSESTMMFGRQHDVSECMDNCIFQIETALLKFNDLGGSEEGKSSIVKRLFFGTLKQRITVAPPDDPRSRPSIHEKEDLFSLLPVNVSDEGFDLYDGLSGYFDDVVEFESKKARMEVTLVELPPVLQIQLQRAQFDRETLQPYKSQAFVKFGETIYMDRFLDDANPEKKERSKSIHLELSTCRDRIHLLTTGKHAPFAPALANSYEFLTGQAIVELPELDQEFRDQLKSEQDYLKTELEGLRARASKLKEELEEIWLGEHNAAYELTSVFIHRGSSPSWGHYFFYSRHLPENPDSWFKYNDSDVSIVPKDEVLADTTGSTANPYMLVYVRKGSDMINTVKRFDPNAIEIAES
ncbi:cysteine proteinase [Artomyces pyxidatus]|uniref:Cysteine proteinase n=1 Tax=Artomyces pyxidatus TaxID=48021 RepID=A0ACB8TE82_9AGAM|nr:cysteine proteinase [Artomyces pyxidatus]